MNFLFPGFLFALTAIAIPVIIHLFNFRKYKKVLFTNVRFLKEVKQQTQAKSRLKHLLVLASRILAIGFLVLAFAQPYIPIEKNRVVLQDNVVSIYIDNSFSMDAENTGGRLLDQAKKMAVGIASGFRQTDRFQLLTNNFEDRQQRLLNRDEFTEQVNDVKMSFHVRSTEEVVRRQEDALQSGLPGGKQAFIISDFQTGNTHIDRIEADSGVAYSLVPVNARKRENLYMDSAWFESPVRMIDQPDQLTVRVTNASDQEYDNIPLKLVINGLQKALGSCSVGPDSYADVRLSFTIGKPGMINGEVSITDYPVTFDDVLFFNYEIAPSLNILCISDSGASDNLRSLYANDPYFKFDQVTSQNIDYSTIPDMNLVILENLELISSGLGDALKKFREQSGSIAVFPGLNADLDNYNAFLRAQLGICSLKKLDTAKRRVEEVNLEHYIFSDVFERVPERMDLPVSHAHYPLVSSGSAAVEPLFTLADGSPFLNCYKEGAGAVYIFSTPLMEKCTNLQDHALFVPVMYKIAIHSQHYDKLYHTLGRDNRIDGPSRSSGSEEGFIYHLTGAGSGIPDFDLIPDIRVIDGAAELILHNLLTAPGNYQLLAEGVSIKGYAFNYDRHESDLSCYGSEDLDEQIKAASLSNFSTLNPGGIEFEHHLASLGEGTKLWKLCIIFALVFLGMETALLRLWK